MSEPKPMANALNLPQHLSQQLSIQYSPGLYRVIFDLSPEQLAAIVTSQGLKLFYLHGANIRNKQTFIHSLAEAAQFPDYAQANWDSLEECLRDLTGRSAAGYVIFYQSPKRFEISAPDDWEIALDILSTAVEFWQKTETPLYVFLSAAE